MKRTLWARVGLVGLMTFAGAAAAQETATDTISTAERLPTVSVEDQAQAAPSHRFGAPNESGASTFDRRSVEARAPGSGDVNQILRALPTVQFSSGEGSATRESLQDMRPAEISISGGAFTDNLFILDGVGVNSLAATGANDNPNHFIEGNARAVSPQSVWVDSSLIGSVTVLDSNVSAEYGQFMGGVVDITTRSPSRAYGGAFHYGETGPDFAEFRVSDYVRNALGGVLPEEPDYSKVRYGISADLPFNDRVRLLLAYNRSETEVMYDRGTNYAMYGRFGQVTESENYLVKGELDLTSNLLLTAQVTHSPYYSEFSHPNGIDNWVYLNGGGATGALTLSGERGESNFQLELTHAYSEGDRTSDRPGTINVQATAPGVDWCSGTSCSLGGANEIYQHQWDTTLRGVWDRPLFDGQLRMGFEISHVDAEKTRPVASAAYRHISSSGAGSTLAMEINPNTVCTPPVLVAQTCVDGAYALAQMNVDEAFESKVDLNTYTAWAEYNFDFVGFDVRAGLRYEYENFLENTNIAPRLSISRELPFWGVNVTAGVNRYYSRNFVGYALRENYPGTYIYRRAPTVIGGQNVWSDDDWELYSYTETAGYSGSGLKTPFTDEFTLAFQGPVGFIGGEYRVRGIIREGREIFSRDAGTTETYTRVNNGVEQTATRTIYRPTNDGERSYEGISLEYLRSFGDHTFSVSTNFSHTDATNIDPFEMADEVDYDGDLVYYNGAVVPRLEAVKDNQLEDYASPFIVNFDWDATWLDGRLRTNFNARFRDGFERVEDTGVNINIGGVNRDVYDEVEFSSTIDVNLAGSLDVYRGSVGATTLDLRVNNLFNSVLDQDSTGTTQPYQMGRNIWVALKHQF